MYHVAWVYGWDDRTQSGQGGHCLGSGVSLAEAVALYLEAWRCPKASWRGPDGLRGEPIITDNRGFRVEPTSETIGELLLLAN